MKQMAKHMRRAGVSPRKRDKDRSKAPSRFPPLLTPEIETGSPIQPARSEGLTEIPDAWDTKHRPETERAAAEARKELADLDAADAAEQRTEDEDGFVYVKRKRVSRKKKRVLSMGFAVSEEEEAILRAHVAGMDTNFSAWARTTLFRAMGKRVPARPKRS